MVFDNTNLGLYTALTAAFSQPGEDPVRKSGAWLIELHTLLAHGHSRRHSSSGDGWRRRLQSGLSWLTGRRRSRTLSRKAGDFESPALEAGQANSPLSGKVNTALTRPISYFQSPFRPRTLRLKRSTRVAACVGARAVDPEGDSRRLSPRRLRSYPLVAETPGVYYVLSGALAGRRA